MKNFGKATDRLGDPHTRDQKKILKEIVDISGFNGGKHGELCPVLLQKSKLLLRDSSGNRFDDNFGLAFDKRFLGDLRVEARSVRKYVHAPRAINQFMYKSPGSGCHQACEISRCMTECEEDLFTREVVDPVFDILKIAFDLLDESAGCLLGPECSPDRMDCGPDVLQRIDFDGEKSNPVFGTEPGERLILSLDDQEIRLEGYDSLLIRIDQSAYLRDCQGFRRVCAEIADPDDSPAAPERKNDLGDTGCCTDDPLRLSCCMVRIGRRCVWSLGGFLSAVRKR